MTPRPIDPETHAVLDHESRLRKGEKIRQLLKEQISLEGCKILDVGTGTGVIANYLLDHVGSNGNVYGVDTEDQRKEGTNIIFERVNDTRLPYPDHTFDIVITNHVIEHVGSCEQQREHLREIARVLKTDGLVYLAQPNRWAITEPHYLLPFLSWLPKSIADVYIRITNRGPEYDCAPLSRAKLKGLCKSVGFEVSDVTGKALQHYAQHEMRVLSRIAYHVPEWFYLGAGRVWCMPTLIMILSKCDSVRTCVGQKSRCDSG